MIVTSFVFAWRVDCVIIMSAFMVRARFCRLSTFAAKFKENKVNLIWILHWSQKTPQVHALTILLQFHSDYMFSCPHFE